MLVQASEDVWLQNRFSPLSLSLSLSLSLERTPKYAPDYSLDHPDFSSVDDSISIEDSWFDRD